MLDIILFIIIILIIILYYHQQPKISSFIDTDKYLPANDIHFIIDTDISHIVHSVKNYKLTQLDGTIKYINCFHHKKMPANTFVYRPLAQVCNVTDSPMTDNDIIDFMKNNKSLHIITSASVIPKSYEKIWTSNDDGNGNKISCYHPIPQSGTATMGDLILPDKDLLDEELLPCLNIQSTISRQYDLLIPSPFPGPILWSAKNKDNITCITWNATNLNFFRCTNTFYTNMPELDRIYQLPLNILEYNTLATF